MMVQRRSSCREPIQEPNQEPSNTAIPGSSLRRVNCEKPGCDKTFASNKSLNVHVARVHDGKRFKCNTCGQLLASKLSLQRHVLDVHKKTYTTTDGTIETAPVDEAIVGTNQDELIERRKNLIESLEEELKQINSDIGSLRGQLKANRQDSTKLPSFSTIKIKKFYSK